jgi:hypothetical protein
MFDSEEDEWSDANLIVGGQSQDALWGRQPCEVRTKRSTTLSVT